MLGWKMSYIIQLPFNHPDFLRRAHKRRHQGVWNGSSSVSDGDVSSTDVPIRAGATLFHSILTLFLMIPGLNE